MYNQDANEGEGTGVSLRGIAASVERELSPHREEREYPEFTFNGLATPPGEGLVINVTYGLKIGAVIFLDSGHIVLAACGPEEILERLRAWRGEVDITNS